MSAMRARLHNSYTDIAADDWNRLDRRAVPFLRHEYLCALEESDSAAPASGWTPRPVAVVDDRGRLVGAVPLWLKSHSFGELVYDFAWAEACARAGLSYYPKLIAALPFSPVTSPRLLVAPGADRAAVSGLLVAAARELADECSASSLHWLFTDDRDTATLDRLGYLHRTAVQFHWHNRSYASFDDFLADFSADKRKKLRRERRQVREAGIVTEVLNGHALTSALWDRFYELYTGNIARHGGMIHLTRDFFARLGRHLADAVLMVLARRGAEIVGAAFYLRGADALYGRYWGGRPDIPGLHFETCYYTAIEYCIAHRIARIEGGAGGEHKLARGFLPVVTHSAHWLRHPQLGHAVADFLRREQRGIERYIDELNAHVPFK
jgi:predicted N-acyltransferase